MANPILARFFQSLTAEEGKVREFLAADHMGIHLRAAISELDLLFYNWGLGDALTEERAEHLYLMRIGTCRLIQLALETRDSFAIPSLSFVRAPSITGSAISVAGRLAVIEHGRRVGQSVTAGVCAITEPEENTFVLQLPSTVVDDEYQEKCVLRHYNGFKRKVIDSIDKNLPNETHEEVQKLLKDLVYVWEQHFIGYAADPLLDDYFFGFAYAAAQSFEGFDTFHHACRFGGIRFQNYVLALACVVAWCNKHVRFAEALIDKDKAIKLENILTVALDKEPLVEAIELGVNHYGGSFGSAEPISREQANQIFEVLSVGRNNSELLERPGAPVPPMVRFSETSFIRCVMGVSDAPMLFLLESLRQRFPGDYARNQQTREHSFQLAVQRVAGKLVAGLQFRKNIKVKLGKQLRTDIDLVMIDPATGTTILCQLKYQDLYGQDLHAKHTRGARLKAQAAQWLSSVDEWVASVGEEGVRASLQVQKDVPPLSIYRLVLAKHFAYPVKTVAVGERVAYCNWVQLVDASIRAGEREQRSLEQLFRTIQEFAEPNGPQEYAPEATKAWVLGDLRFVTTQVDSMRSPGSSDT